MASRQELGRIRAGRRESGIGRAWERLGISFLPVPETRGD